MPKKQVVAALRLQRAATVHRLAGLGAEQWDQRLPSGWTVRDTVGQLVTVESALMRGSYVRAVRRSRSLPELNAWLALRAQRFRDRSPQEHLDALVSSGARFTGLVGRLPSFAWQPRIAGPLGPQPLIHLVYLHILREWAMEWQVGAAWGDDLTPPTPAVAEAVTAAVECALPGLVLPAIDRTAGVLRVVVELGDDARRVFGMDFARKHYGRRITAAPTAVLRLDAATLAAVATGHLLWRDQLGGHISAEGDTTLAEVVLDALLVPV